MSAEAFVTATGSVAPRAMGDQVVKRAPVVNAKVLAAAISTHIGVRKAWGWSGMVLHRAIYLHMQA